jgi:hypothetical protein
MCIRAINELVSATSSWIGLATSETAAPTQLLLHVAASVSANEAKQPELYA